MWDHKKVGNNIIKLVTLGVLFLRQATGVATKQTTPAGR